ncbi:hypothetical protein E2C01_096283 [Portunus trituberculatus]|uniref:Uncharacterized protein n=1 Tax=Portunus trituberculatus TaxID=210409 RepID=A0A5B7K2D2_PORTR|nr:hypothetical protein [Portunus trituberculatus]
MVGRHRQCFLGGAASGQCPGKKTQEVTQPSSRPTPHGTKATLYLAQPFLFVKTERFSCLIC